MIVERDEGAVRGAFDVAGGWRRCVFAWAGVRVTLDRPADPDAVVRGAEAAGDARRGYWAHLWSSSVVLARWASATPMLGPGVGVTEIGCGLGLCGLAAAARGCAVSLTDADPAALGAARHNAALNGASPGCASAGGVAVRGLDWSDDNARVAGGVIIGADVLYTGGARRAVARLIGSSGAVAVLAEPGRTGADGVVGDLEAEGVRCRVEAGEGHRLIVAQRRGRG